MGKLGECFVQFAGLCIVRLLQFLYYLSITSSILLQNLLYGFKEIGGDSSQTVRAAHLGGRFPETSGLAATYGHAVYALGEGVNGSRIAQPVRDWEVARVGANSGAYGDGCRVN